MAVGCSADCSICLQETDEFEHRKTGRNGLKDMMAMGRDGMQSHSDFATSRHGFPFEFSFACDEKTIFTLILVIIIISIIYDCSALTRLNCEHHQFLAPIT